MAGACKQKEYYNWNRPTQELIRDCAGVVVVSTERDPERRQQHEEEVRSDVSYSGNGVVNEVAPHHSECDEKTDAPDERYASRKPATGPAESYSSVSEEGRKRQRRWHQVQKGITLATRQPAEDRQDSQPYQQHQSRRRECTWVRGS